VYFPSRAGGSSGEGDGTSKPKSFCFILTSSMKSGFTLYFPFSWKKNVFTRGEQSHLDCCSVIFFPFPILNRPKRGVLPACMETVSQSWREGTHIANAQSPVPALPKAGTHSKITATQLSVTDTLTRSKHPQCHPRPFPSLPGTARTARLSHTRRHVPRPAALCAPVATPPPTFKGSKTSEE